MKTTLASALILITLSACVNTQAVPAENDKIPYPSIDQFDLQRQIDLLSVEVTRLQNRVDELEKRQFTPTRAKPKSYSTRTTPVADNPKESKSSPNLPSQAQTLFQQKQYQRLIDHINQTENSNTINAQNLHFLIQSHYQLNNCQSVIDLSRRYLSRFRNTTQAPNVMHQIGWCQWKMQQKDIARDTWRQLIRIYPQSKAAKKAQTDLKK